MAVPECLVDFIGIRGVCAEVSEGGLWIDDMPDSGIVKFEALSGLEFVDFKKVWDKVYRRTCENWISDIRKLLDPRMKTNPVLSNSQTGRFDQTQVSSAGAFYSGETFTISGSPYMEIFIPEVKILSSVAGNTTVKIWDIDTGEELFTKDVIGVLGTNVVQVNTTIPLNYGKRKLFIGFLRSTWNGFKATSSACGCESGCDGVFLSHIPQSIPTGDISPFDPTALVDDSANAGIIVRFGLRCSLNEFVCQNRDVLNVSLRFKAYIELLAEILYNDTLTNKVTLVSREETRTRITEFGAMYQNELSLILDSIPYDSDSICFECNEPIKSVYIHP